MLLCCSYAQKKFDSLPNHIPASFSDLFRVMKSAASSMNQRATKLSLYIAFHSHCSECIGHSPCKCQFARSHQPALPSFRSHVPHPAREGRVDDALRPQLHHSQRVGIPPNGLRRADQGADPRETVAGSGGSHGGGPSRGAAAGVRHLVCAEGGGGAEGTPPAGGCGAGGAAEAAGV